MPYDVKISVVRIRTHELTLVNILSIKVAETAVILVSLLIAGKKNEKTCN